MSFVHIASAYRNSALIEAAWAQLLALAIVGTSATAVVLHGVRLSDVCFAVSIFLILCAALKSVQTDGVSAVFRSLSPILILLVVAAVGSTLVNYFFSPAQEFRFFDLLAICLSILTAVLLAACDARLALLTAAKTATTVVGVFTPLMLVYLIVGNPSWVILHEDFGRFAGLSQNPNQFALLLLPVPFFVLIAYVHGLRSIYISLLELSVLFALNWLCIGKALFFSWLASFVVVGFLILLSRGKGVKKTLMLVAYSAIVVVGVAAMGRIMLQLYEGTTRGSIEGQGENRLILWVNGFKAWMEAPIVGHGAGHYSGVEQLFEAMEAHNFLIDWLSAYGAVGGTLLLWFYVRVFKTAFLHSASLSIGICLCLVAQGFFHFYGRQPMYWFWWVLAAQLSSFTSGKWQGRLV